MGNHIQWSKTWLTFNDFLFAYIKAVLTPQWGQAEQSKPEGEQHPLMHWLRRIAVAMRSTQAGLTPAKINTAPMTGASRAYLGLAYDLYLSAHNAELPELLVKRLRNAKTFEGALYEASMWSANSPLQASLSSSRMRVTRLSRIANSLPPTR